MTVRLGRRSGVVAALLATIFVLAPIRPALAAAADAVRQPAENAVLDSSVVMVRGTLEADPLAELVTITLTIGREVKTVSCSKSPSSCPFSWDVPLAANGPYFLDVVGHQQGLGGVLTAPDRSAPRRNFKLAAPPQRPTLDRPRVTDARTVELAWTRNTEPDILRYSVSRKAPGATAFTPLKDVPQPPPGSKVFYTDTSTSVFGGGDFAYQVVAVRRGASGTDGADTVSSAPSDAATAGVAAPATSTTAAVAPPGAPGAPGGATTAKPGQAGGVDLPGFLSSRSQPAVLPPITVPQAPDPGFQGTLPFGARPPGADIEEGDAEAVTPPDRSSSSVVSAGDASRPLVPVAAGLLLLVLAMHLRLLNRRLKPAAGGDLPVDLHRAADMAPGASPPAVPAVVALARQPEPEPEPEQHTRSFNALQEPAWSPEPEPEPEPAWSPEPEPRAQFYDILQEPEWVPYPEAVLEPEPAEGHWAAAEPERDEAEWGYEEAEAEWGPEPAYAVDPDVPVGPEPELRWAPPEDDVLGDGDEIEVFDVVSPNRRRLARSGSR